MKDERTLETPTWGCVKDSGEREQFDTGSRRDTRAGKGRFDLITPFMLLRLARHYENGAVKYGDRNWEKGQPSSRAMDSAMRHLNAFMINAMLGQEQDEDHLSAAIWNLAVIIHNEHCLPEMNDLKNLLDKS